MGPPTGCVPAEGLRAPRRTLRNHAFRRSPAAAIESALLRKSVGAADRRAAALRHCHRTPLVGERVYLYAAQARLRAVPAAPPRGRRSAPSSCARPSTSGPCASAGAACGRTPGRRGPRRALHHDRPPARGGLRVPRRHREPPGVHRPLPEGLAADPGWTPTAAAPAPATASTRRSSASAGATSPSSRSRRRAGSSPSAAAASSTASRPSRAGRSSPPGGGTRVEFTFETEPALPTDRLMEAFGFRGWFKRKSSKALRRLRGDPRGRTRAAARGRPSRGSRLARRGDPPPAHASSPSPPRSRWRAAATRTRRVTVGRDRGHLPRRRRPQVPGPDLAHHQPARHRGPPLPDRAAAPARCSRRPTRRGSASGMRVQNTTSEEHAADAAEEFEIVDTQENEFEPIELDGRTRSPTRRSALGPNTVLPELGVARRPGRRSRARCCCSSSPPRRSRTGPLEFKIASPTARRRSASSTSTSSR